MIHFEVIRSPVEAFTETKCSPKRARPVGISSTRLMMSSRIGISRAVATLVSFDRRGHRSRMTVAMKHIEKIAQETRTPAPATCLGRGMSSEDLRDGICPVIYDRQELPGHGRSKDPQSAFYSLDPACCGAIRALEESRDRLGQDADEHQRGVFRSRTHVNRFARAAHVG